MPSTRLIHWSGFSAFLGGALWVLQNAAWVLLIGEEGQNVGLETVIKIIWLVSLLLIVLGLMGLYAYQAERAGWLGRIAFLVAFLGTQLRIGTAWYSTFALPAVRALRETVPGDEAEPELLVAGFLSTLLLFMVGWLLFGVATLRARVLPRGAALLVLLGTILWPLPLELENPVVGIASGMLFAGLAWMGWALWQSRQLTPGAAQPAKSST